MTKTHISLQSGTTIVLRKGDTFTVRKLAQKKWEIIHHMADSNGPGATVETVTTKRVAQARAATLNGFVEALPEPTTTASGSWLSRLWAWVRSFGA